MNSSQDISSVWEELVCDGGRIVYLWFWTAPADCVTAQAARQPWNWHVPPHLDRVMHESACGLLELVGPGITPGSGPGHLALFGYDPLQFRIGRGVLAALGIDFDLHEGDVAARINFATVDNESRVTDRRAGRISTELNQRLCEKIRNTVQLDFNGEYFLETVAEHRAVLVLRGENLAAAIEDTDPQSTGVPPRTPEAKSVSARQPVALVQSFIAQAFAALAGEEPANALLLRGFARHAPFPTLQQRFALEGLCIAKYPMYRGLSRLLGMEVATAPDNLDAAFNLLEEHYPKAHNFYFLHVKGTDKSGEDNDFAQKVSVIEQVDAMVPRILALEPEVLVVTADHSTPAAMAAHSWHPVPVLIHAANARADEILHFDEYTCRGGGLGLRPGVHLMGLALAHAGRLDKFGA